MMALPILAMDARERTVPGGVGGLRCERVAAVIVRAEAGGILPVRISRTSSTRRRTARPMVISCAATGRSARRWRHAYSMPV